jgi:excisionase family DNA binding protein
LLDGLVERVAVRVAELVSERLVELPKTEVSPVMDAEAAAKYVGLTKARIYRLHETGHLPATSVGRSLRFHRRDLDRLLHQGVPIVRRSSSATVEDGDTIGKGDVDTSTDLASAQPRVVPFPTDRGRNRNGG